MEKYIDFGAKGKRNISNMGVKITTDLEGKIDNFKGFRSEALTPLFEAIVNSIQAIKERKDLEKGKITINVIREQYAQKELPPQDHKGNESKKQLSEIKIFEIVDNGIGFNNPNFDSFAVSDSTYKKSRGGKGIGRFSWLKAFNEIEIDSVYSENGSKKKRSFKVAGSGRTWIEPSDGNVTSVPIMTEQKTIIRLIGFKKEYRTSRTAYKTTEKIAQRILEHLLIYYIQKIIPSIMICDGGTNFNLDELYQKIESDSEIIVVGDEQFTVYHVKLYHTRKDAHKIVFCANDRDVKTYKNIIQQIIGTTSLQDGNTSFYYAAYVSGKFFDDRLDSGRTSFDIQDEIDESESLGGEMVSLNIIRDRVVERATNYLSKYIEEIKEKKIRMLSNFALNNPETRHVVNYYPNIINEVDIGASEEEINKIVYKYKGIAEWEIRRGAKELFKDSHLQNIQDIDEKCKKLSEQIKSIQKDDLAQYLLKRRLIIDLFERKLGLKADGKYDLESEIHDILFPRNTSNDEILFEDHNLWMIDENLAFHHCAYSNIGLDKISTSESNDIPDILIFDDVDDNSVAKLVSIIELKRPERPNLDKSPIEYMLNIIADLIDRKIQYKGRYIEVDASTRYNCILICSINDVIKKEIINKDLIQLAGNLGYYGFHKQRKAFIEVLAYDQLLNDVKRRHNAFFDKLGIKKIN